MADIFGAVKNIATLGAYDANKALDAQASASDNAYRAAIYQANDIRNRRYITAPVKADTQTNAMDAFINAQRQALANAQANQQVYAPNLNLAGIASQARKAAAGAVNPFYTKSLNDFVSQQVYEKKQQEAQTATNIQDLQDQLNNTLQQNNITGQRTTQDVNTNLGQINTTADQFQTDSGTAYDQARLAQAKNVSSGGIGQQQLAAAQKANATTEGRQEQQFTQQRNQQNLYKARTFEDLARAGELAKTTETKGAKQAQFDLNQFIKEQGFSLGLKKTDLEIARQNALDTAAQKQGQALVNKFISSIANPAQRQAARQAYGGLSF